LLQLEWQCNPGEPVGVFESDIEETSPGRAYAYNLGLLDWLFKNTMEEHIGLWNTTQMCCGCAVECTVVERQLESLRLPDMAMVWTNGDTF